MLTSKGNTTQTLIGISAQNNTLTLHFPPSRPHGLVVPDDTVSGKMADHINSILSADKKGAGTYKKCLEQIELHRDLLIKAYAKLFESYTYATTPQQRTSPVEKARRDMLTSLPDKLLKATALVHLSEEVIDDLILPNDRVEMIERVLAKMKDADIK